MRRAIFVMVVLTSAVCGTLDASADGIAIKRPIKKVLVYPATCVHSRCLVPRVLCPDGYSCFSLYGGYGPYGGSLYWTRYTYAGWSHR